MKIWRRNAVVSVIVLFVCVALYLSWSYGRTPEEETPVFDPAVSAQTGLNPSDIADSSINGDVLDEETIISDTDSDNYFSAARLSRKKARDDAYVILTDAATRTEASQEIRDNAAGEIEKMAQYAIIEATIENLILAKGFSDCVVFINQNGIDIVVAEPEGGMTATHAAIIKDIVLSESSMQAGDIKLVHVSV